jgi:glycosyltransferase involved in cell wall biosynthesis
LSIVVPVYNEAATIRTIIGRVIGVPLPKEVIIVDDCSTDGTREILQSLESSPLFTVFYKPVNQGKGAALRTGFSLASGDVIVVQDADLEYDPHDIPAVIKPLVDNTSDVVFGSRFLGAEPQDKSITHRMGNQLLTLASNLFTGWSITDMETCYKAFRRSALDGVVLKQNRFGFEPEITAKLARRNLRVTEVPIHYQARGYAEGKKIGVRDLFNALWCIIRYGLAD